MKKLIVKYIISISAIVLAINVVLVLIASFQINSIMTSKIIEMGQKQITVLTDTLVTGKIVPKQMQRILKEIAVQPSIMNSVVTDENQKVILAHGTKKHDNILDLFSFKLPLKKDDHVLGYLKVWISPEFIVSEVMNKKNRNRVVYSFLFWFILAIGLLYLFIYWNLLAPLKSLDAYVDQIEKDNFRSIEIKTAFPLWQKVAKKLNRVNEKLSDVSNTLQVLFSASKTLTSSIEINEIFNTVLSIIQKKFEGISCCIYLLEEDGFLRIKNHKGISPDFVHSIRLRPGEDFIGKSFRECQTIIINDCSKENSPITLMLKESEGLESYISIPLMVESKCVGVLNANSFEKNYFTDEKIKTLSTLAEYLSIGLRNARLYERIQEYNRRLGVEISSTTRELMQTNSRLIQKAREMKTLSDISASAASKGDLPEIFNNVIKNIKELLSVQSAGFFLYNSETEEIVPTAPFFGIYNKDLNSLMIKYNEFPILKSVIQEKKSYIFNISQEAQDALPMLANLANLQSLVLVPLHSKNKVVGMLGVINKVTSTFTKDDLRILELIADRVSSIIENALLYHELEHRLRDLTILQEISSSISSEPMLDKTLKKVVSATVKTFSADLCDLVLYDPVTKELVSQPGAYFTGGEDVIAVKEKANDEKSLLAQVFLEGKSILSPDASIDPNIQSPSLRLWDIRSLVLVPMKAENRVIGVLRIGRHKANCYRSEHLVLAELVAHQAAIIIENARLYYSLRDTKEELERLNKIKNEFISIVSHELRTPITAVKGFVKVVLNKDAGELNPQQEKFLGIADQSIDRLITLVAELLDISRIESGKIKFNFMSFNAQEIIKNVVQNAAPESLGKQIVIEVNLPDTLPEVFADKERLSQVFENLINNGIKFTPNSGKITITARDKGDFVLFGIKDTGVGIDKKDKEKIFEKFYRVDSAFNRAIVGAGLGLAIVKSIIEMHGGEIWVENNKGGGSHFQFMIPRAKPEIKNLKNNL